MRSPQFCVRFPPEIAEEVYRLAKANGISQSDMIRELVRDGIIVRAETTTNSQFQYVEQRLCRIEERFVGWMIKLSKATSQTWFFTEQLALFEVDESDQRALKAAAERFMRQFLQIRTSRYEQEHPDQDE